VCDEQAAEGEPQPFGASWRHRTRSKAGAAIPNRIADMSKPLVLALQQQPDGWWFTAYISGKRTDFGPFTDREIAIAERRFLIEKIAGNEDSARLVALGRRRIDQAVPLGSKG
jgi:hypothetical protein